MTELDGRLLQVPGRSGSVRDVRSIGPFRLLTRLASGHLGELFAARDAESEARWAVQIARPELARDRRFGRLLMTEASAAGRLAHPGAATPTDAGREGEEVYVACPLVSGLPLSAFLERDRVERSRGGRALLPQSWLSVLAADVAESLAVAHRLPWFPGAPAPMVHGSLSPRCVMLTWDGRVVLTGLGTGRARWSIDPSPARLAHLAPERFLERDPTPHTDAWSLGVILYDALTGRRAFQRATEEETRAAVREANAPPLHAGDLDVRLEVAELLRQMMAPRTEDRPDDLGEVAATLRWAANVDEGEVRDGLARLLGAHFSEARAAGERRLAALDRLELEPGLAPERSATLPPAGAWTVDLDAPRPASAPRGGPGAPMVESTSAPAGRPRVGRYLLEARLPGSGPRVIHRARDPNIGRTVVVHSLDPGALTDRRLPPETWVRLFKREARLAGRLHHPRLPALLDAGRAGARYFSVYRFVPGVTLAERLERGQPLSPAEVAGFGADWAEALAALHDAGIVHGDARASNLVLGTEGRGGSVLDLSFASPREAHAPASSNEPGDGAEHPLRRQNLLTQAPETLDGAPYGVLAEQFALGATLYQALVGTRPFRGLIDEELERAIRAAEPRPPEDMGVECPAPLGAALHRMLAARPGDRFADLHEVVLALRGGAPPLETVAEAPARAAPLAARPGDDLWGCLARLASKARGIDDGADAVSVRTAAAIAGRSGHPEDAQHAPLLAAWARLGGAGRSLRELEELVPASARPGLSALESLLRGAAPDPLPRAAAIAWLAVRYHALARPPEGDGQSSPRGAVLTLRREAEARALDPELLLGLTEHLRERLSALELSESPSELEPEAGTPLVSAPPAPNDEARVEVVRGGRSP